MAHDHKGRYVGLTKVELTVECIDCKEDQVFLVPADEYEVYVKGVAHIQKALPSVAADKRELLISGICGRCWDKMFAGADR